jgi:aminomethyltransferase
MNEAAYEALRQRAAWIDLTGRGKIRATGEDRVRLLHAMTTNHVEQLQPGKGCYAFFLTAQGKIIADVNIFCMPDYLLLDTEPETKQRVYEHLDKYIIADDVTLHDFTAETATINVEGPQAESLLREIGVPVAHAACYIAEWGRGQVAHVSYTGGPGYSMFLPRDEKSGFIEKLTKSGIPEAEPGTADVVRLENGRPRYGVDISEAQIPQETQQMQALHFSKGCYLGQEIVERVRARGHVNRQLTPIQMENGNVPGSGTKVEIDGKEVGEITSAVYSPGLGKVVGFAMLRLEALQPSASLSAAGSKLTVANRPEQPSRCADSD